MLGVPRKIVPKKMISIVRFFNRIISDEEQEDAHVQAVLEIFSRRLVIGLEHSWRGGNRTRFEIPPSLRGNWKLES